MSPGSGHPWDPARFGAVRVPRDPGRTGTRTERVRHRVTFDRAPSRAAIRRFEEVRTPRRRTDPRPGQPLVAPRSLDTAVHPEHHPPPVGWIVGSEDFSRPRRSEDAQPAGLCHAVDLDAGVVACARPVRSLRVWSELPWRRVRMLGLRVCDRCELAADA